MDWYTQRSRTRQLEIEKREAELKYLKAQINPHFLFNTLNNLYGLSIERSAKVPGLLLNLSDFLSYSLYESSASKISIRKEIQLLQNFVTLETDRYEADRVVVQWELDETLFNEEIGSLLFFPLVENAFKHGVKEEIRNAQILIKLERLEVDTLLFEVTNTIGSNPTKEPSSGLGLVNLRRRLELLYPNRFQLNNEFVNHQYIASLKLIFNDEN